jgi:2-C-methyl-D-erythritol 2,4-cyclodiphosphate synthase
MAADAAGGGHMTLRIGQGFDVHAFASGRKLILGGIEIPYELGLAGHSDADVLVHALCDALLGAAGLGDIGQHYPDNDDRFSGVDSMKLLADIVAKLKAQGWSVGNVDMTVIAQAPKLAPYIPEMRQQIAAMLGVAVEQINVKATTTEQLGFTGRKEGIAAQAVALINS